VRRASLRMNYPTFVEKLIIISRHFKITYQKEKENQGIFAA
jgi:hypothetical protein